MSCSRGHVAPPFKLLRHATGEATGSGKGPGDVGLPKVLRENDGCIGLSLTC